MSVLTEERLAEIEARAQAATPGPWEALPGSFQGKANVLTASPDDWTQAPLVISHMHYHNAAADFALIAHAREDVPALVAEVRRLRGLLSYIEAYFQSGMPVAWGDQIATKLAAENLPEVTL